MPEVRPGAGSIRAKRPSRRLQRQLVIRTSDPPDQWRHFLRTLEELAERGEFVDCHDVPLELHHASTPLRRVAPRKPTRPVAARKAPDGAAGGPRRWPHDLS